MNKIYGYYRTDEQNKDSEKQEKAIWDYARKNKIPIYRILFDECSADHAEQKQYQSLVKNKLHPGDALIIENENMLGTTSGNILHELIGLDEKHVQIIVMSMKSTAQNLSGLEYGDEKEEIICKNNGKLINAYETIIRIEDPECYAETETDTYKQKDETTETQEEEEEQYMLQEEMQNEEWYGYSETADNSMPISQKPIPSEETRNISVLSAESGIQKKYYVPKSIDEFWNKYRSFKNLGLSQKEIASAMNMSDGTFYAMLKKGREMQGSRESNTGMANNDEAENKFNGEALDMLLFMNKMTSEDLADKIEKHKYSIDDWISGEHKPNSTSLKQITDYFNVKRSLFFGEISIRKFGEAGAFPTVSSRILYLMKRCNLSEEEFIKESGSDKDTVERYLDNHARTDSRTFKKFAEFFNVPTYFLRYGFYDFDEDAEPPKEFGSIILDLMESTHTCGKEVAEHIGIPHEKLSAYTRGDLIPDDDVVRKLSDEFSVSFESLKNPLLLYTDIYEKIFDKKKKNPEQKKTEDRGIRQLSLDDIQSDSEKISDKNENIPETETPAQPSLQKEVSADENPNEKKFAGTKEEKTDSAPFSSDTMQQAAETESGKKEKPEGDRFNYVATRNDLILEIMEISCQLDSMQKQDFSDTLEYLAKKIS